MQSLGAGWVVEGEGVPGNASLRGREIYKQAIPSMLRLAVSPPPPPQGATFILLLTSPTTSRALNIVLTIPTHRPDGSIITLHLTDEEAETVSHLAQDRHRSRVGKIGFKRLSV